MANTFVKTRHDIGVTNSNGDVVGMMIAKRKDGTPAYAVYDRKHLADQFFTGIPVAGYQDPEVEIPISQYSWRAGMGLKVYDNAQPERYYKAVNCDLRIIGKVMLSYQPSSATKPVAVNCTVVNPGFETDAINAGWTGVNAYSGTSNYSTVNPYADTRCWLMLPGAGGTREIYQDVVDWVPGVQFKLECAINTNVPPTAGTYARGWLNDGVQANSFTANGTTTWGLKTSTLTMDANSKWLRVHLIAEETAEHRFDAVQVMINSGSATIYPSVAEAKFNNNQYLSFGKILGKLQANGAGFSIVHSFPNNITCLNPFTDDCLYIGQGNVNAYWQMNTAEGFTQYAVASSVNTMQFMVTAHAASPTAWGNSDNFRIRSTTAPRDGGTAWSDPPTNVGSSYYNITKLLYGSGTVYIFKEDKPYYLNSSNQVQDDLADEMENLYTSKSGKAATYWNGNIYVPATSHLLEIDGTVKTWLQPALYCSDLPEYTGDIDGLAGDEEYLYAACSNSGKVQILAGRWEILDSTTDWRWHPIRTLAMTNCELMFTSSIYKRRLYITSTNASDPIYYIPLPDNYSDMAQDAQRNFVSGGYFHTPWLHGGFRLTPKAFTELECELGHSSNPNIYWETFYRIFPQTAWTFIGNMKGSSPSRIASNYLPDTTIGAIHPVDPMIQLNFCGITSSYSVTPELIGYTLRSILYPPRRDIIACQVIAAQEIQTKDTIERNRFDDIRQTLRETKNATWPVKIYDLDGDPVNVKFLPLPSGTPRFEIIKNEKGRVEERVYNLMMQEVNMGGATHENPPPK